MSLGRACPACVREGAVQPVEGCPHCSATPFVPSQGVGVRGAALLAALVGGVSACGGASAGSASAEGAPMEERALPGEVAPAPAPAEAPAVETESPAVEAPAEVEDTPVQDARVDEQPHAPVETDSVEEAPPAPVEAPVQVAQVTPGAREEQRAQGPPDEVRARQIAAYGGPPDRDSLTTAQPVWQFSESSVHVEADTGATAPSSSEVHRTLRRHLSRLQNAFSWAAQQSPPAGPGRMVVQFSVGENGRIDDVELELTGFGNSTFEERVARRLPLELMRVRFQPSRTTGTYRVRWEATVEATGDHSPRTSPQLPPGSVPAPTPLRPPEVGPSDRPGPVPVYGAPPMQRRGR